MRRPVLAADSRWRWPRESGNEHPTSSNKNPTPVTIHHSPFTTSSRHTPNARRRARSTGLLALPAISCMCFANLAADAPHADDWRHLLTDKVLACGIAAVALLVLSLLLRGLLKVITLLIVLVLAAGVFWFLRDGLGVQSEALPREWTKLAEHTLDSQKARDAWQAVQAELAKLSTDARSRLSAGTDDARRVVVAKLEAHAQKLRKEGSTAEAEQMARFAAMMEKQK